MTVDTASPQLGAEVSEMLSLSFGFSLDFLTEVNRPNSYEGKKSTDQCGMWAEKVSRKPRIGQGTSVIFLPFAIVLVQPAGRQRGTLISAISLRILKNDFRVFNIMF